MLRAQSSFPAFVLFAIVFVTLLGAAPAFAGEPAQAPAGATATAVQAPSPNASTLNLADLSGQTTPAKSCAIAAPDAQVPDFMASHRLGYCHCGCVAQRVCRTSADCGGASCDQFISCC